MNRNEEEMVRIAECAERRQFLRNALKIGGAAALLLTSSSREVLARSLSLSEQELDAARQARQTPAGSQGVRRAAGTMEFENSGACDGCEGTCTGACTGGCTSCSGTCSGGCASGCTGGNN